MARSKKESKVEAAPEAVSRKTARAVCRYLRVSPRKLRLVIDAVRRKPVPQALASLAVIRKKGARMTEKLLRSAVANAKDLGLDVDRLYVSKVFADGGPTFKRFIARSMGRADRIIKRTSHLSIEVAEGEKSYRKKTIETAPAEEQKGGKKTRAKKKTAKAAAAAKA